MKVDRYIQLLLLVVLALFITSCGTQSTPPTITSNNTNNRVSQASNTPIAPKSTSPTGTSSNTGSKPSNNPSTPGGYLATGSTYVLFIQFTNTNGTLSGEWDEAYDVRNTNNVLQVNTFNTSFSALLNGTQFNLTIDGHTYAGSFNGNNVTIEFPQQDGTLTPITLTPASVSDYNNAIAAFENSVNQANQITANAQATTTSIEATATVTTDEQNRLNYDLSNIGGAIQQLASDSNFSSLFKDYTNNLNQMQTDYQTEQNDAKVGCSNANQVSADANQVSADNNQTSANDNQLKADNNQVSSDLSNVQGYVSKIEQHWSNLGNSSPGVTQNEIDTAVHNGNTAIQNAQAAVSSATSQIHGYDSTSQQILQQANNLYTSMKC